VLAQLRGLLWAPGMVGNVVNRAVELDSTLDEAEVTVAMIRLDRIWEQLCPAEQQRMREGHRLAERHRGTATG